MKQLRRKAKQKEEKALLGGLLLPRRLSLRFFFLNFVLRRSSPREDVVEMIIPL